MSELISKTVREFIKHSTLHEFSVLCRSKPLLVCSSKPQIMDLTTNASHYVMSLLCLIGSQQCN